MTDALPAPVMVGSDLGVYSMARAFHQRWGVHSHTVSKLPRGFINDSAILTPVLLGEHGTPADQRAALDRLSALARDRGTEPVLVVNSDSQVDAVDADRAWHEERFTVLVPPGESVRAVEDKARLAPSPPRWVSTPPGAGDRLRAARRLAGRRGGPRRPLHPEAGDDGDYEVLEFPGKLKVYVLDDVAALEATLERIHAAGYGGGCSFRS